MYLVFIWNSNLTEHLVTLFAKPGNCLLNKIPSLRFPKFRGWRETISPSLYHRPDSQQLISYPGKLFLSVSALLVPSKYVFYLLLLCTFFSLISTHFSTTHIEASSSLLCLCPLLSFLSPFHSLISQQFITWGLKKTRNFSLQLGSPSREKASLSPFPISLPQFWAHGTLGSS